MQGKEIFPDISARCHQCKLRFNKSMSQESRTAESGCGIFEVGQLQAHLYDGLRAKWEQGT